MGFENSAFPLTSGTAYNHYGARDTEAGGVLSGGKLPGEEGAEKEAVIYITGDDFAGTTSSIVRPFQFSTISSMLEHCFG